LNLEGFEVGLMTINYHQLTPFGTHNHWTGGVPCAGITISIRIQIVPENGGSSLGRHIISHVSKDGGSTLFDISQLEGGAHNLNNLVINPYNYSHRKAQ